MEHYSISFKDKMLVLSPVRELSDEEYDRIKPIVEEMGGHWREKLKGFVIPSDKSHREVYTQRNEDIQFFPTPNTLAKRMVELSGIQNWSSSDYPRVLEPSAGTGNLLDALPKCVNPSMYIVEPDAENAETLIRKGYWMVNKLTFEEFSKRCKKLRKTMDFVIMNPPFSKSRDVIHTMMAYEFLKEGGTLVAIVSENAMYYENEHSESFRKWLKDVDAYIEEIPYGSFRESGTTVDTVIIKVTK